MQKILICDPDMNDIAHNLLKAHEFKTELTSWGSQKKSETLPLSKVVATGTHAKFIRIVCESKHFDAAKRIADAFGMNTGPDRILILDSGGPNKEALTVEFLFAENKNDWSLAFFVGNFAGFDLASLPAHKESFAEYVAAA